MCGTEAQIYRTKIEDTFLNVCSKCAAHGEVVEKVKEKEEEKKKEKEIISRPEIIQIINKNYAYVVKNAREKTGMKQKELAQKIAEKESVIHKIESGHFEPNIKLARKLEKFLNITLVEQHKEENKNQFKKTTGEEFTLGDMIKIKKR